MTKLDLINNIYEKLGLSKKESADLVNMVFDTIKESLERGENVKLSGFANFMVRKKRARIGRNPQTGQEIEISERNVLRFKPSHVFKKLINS